MLHCPCPICRQDNLTLVHYIYGDDLRQSAGQARRTPELHTLAMTVREFQVFVVEVCQSCCWNHLIEQYLLGRGALDPPVPDRAVNASPPGRDPTTGPSSHSREYRW